MKKLFTLMLSIALFTGSSAFAAKTYLVQLGTSGAVSWRAAGVGDTIVDLSVVGAAGASVTLNQWLDDKRFAKPVFSAHQFASGDQIWLAAGTYNINGRDSLLAGVSMYGGFAGTEYAITERAKASPLAWDFTNASIIDGSGTYIGIMTTYSGTLASVIDGITFQNCTNSNRNGSGGGAKITGAKTIMQNCIVTGCKSVGSLTTGASAGVSVLSKGTLKDSYIHHNTGPLTSGGVTVYGDTCVVSGCKIDYNTSGSTGNGSGGGLYLYSKTSGVKILNCSFSNNSATAGSGGCISCYITATNASPITISNCTFTGNTTVGSGGAMLLSSGATNVFNISGCTFTSNSSTTTTANSSYGGGALNLSTSAFNIDNCTFKGNNTTNDSGGAINIPTTSSCLITNSKFIGNTAGTVVSTQGSAIYSKTNYTANNCLFAGNIGSTLISFYQSTSASSFNNCTFANNLTSTGTSTSIGLLALTPKYAFTNCLFNKISNAFTGTTAPLITNCGFETTIPAVGVNCVTDITDASFKDYANGNYSLGEYSPAIDAGLNLADSVGHKKVTTDILGCARPVGAGYDMGCYELGGVPSTAVFTPRQDIIGFSVLKSGIVSKFAGVVQVYSITGKMHKKGLVSEGEQITLQSGVYIVRLYTTNGIISQKIVL